MNELFWFGYIVAWIGVCADVAGAATPVWIAIYAFGIGVAFAETAVTYYNDYIKPYVRTESTTDE